MKLSMKTLICLALLSFVAVSCGSEKSKGGGSKSYSAYSASAYFTQSSQYAMDNVLAWYNSNTEGSFPNPNFPGVKTEERTLKTFSPATNPCTSTNYYGIITLTSCNHSSPSPISTVTSTNQVPMIPGQVKSNNPKLAQALSGSGMTLYEAVQMSSGWQAVYILKYYKANGHTVKYTIDTGVNSAFNPIATEDSETNTKEELSSIY